MTRRLVSILVIATVLVAGTGVASAKTFRYDGGPQAPADTTLAEAVPELEPIVRARGPRVPLTNLQLVSVVARTAFEKGLQGAPLSDVKEVVVAPIGSHPLNFVAEHAVLRQLSARGVSAVVRRTPIADDSLVAASNPGTPVLEYQMASARATYIRLTGWLPGRVKIERQGLVEARITLRDPARSTVRWSGEAAHALVDAFPRSQVSLVEDARYPDLKGEVPGRSIDKVVEPVIVVAIVAGLVALFFQNRP